MGYDAGYYSYLWSEVYSHDMYAAFKDAPGGCMSRDMGKRFRECVLDQGANMEGSQMLENFLGRPASNRAFYKEIGIEK